MTSKLKSSDIISTKSDRETNEGSRDRSESSQKSSQDGATDDEGSVRKDKHIRIKHNEVERRRKDKINTWILRIGQLLSNKDPSKMNKTGILENAAKYIVESQRSQEKLLMGKCTEVQVGVIKSLRKKISSLEEQTERYEKLLLIAGIPLSADPTKSWISKFKTSDCSQSGASTSAADTTQVTSSSKNDPPCSLIEATSTSGDLALGQEEATSSSKKKSKNTVSSQLESMKSKSKDVSIISTGPSGLEVLQTGQILTSALPGRAAVIHGTPAITTITVNPNIVGMAPSPDSRTPLNTATMIGSNAMVTSNSNLLPLSQILTQGSVPVMMNQNSLIFISPSATKVQNSTNLLNNQLNTVSSQPVLSNTTSPQTSLPINQVTTKEPLNSPNIAKSSPSIGSTSGILYNTSIQQEEIPPTANPSTTAVTQSLDGQPIMSTNQGNGFLHIPTGSNVSFIQGSHVPVGTHNQMQPIIFINEQGIPIIQTWPSPFMVTQSQDNQSESQNGVGECQELSNDCVSHLGMPVINIIPQSNANLQSSDSQCQQSLKITQFNPSHQVTSPFLTQTNNSQVMTQHFLNHVQISQDKQIQQLVDNQTPISLTISQAQQAQLQPHLTVSGLAQQQQQQRQLQQQLQQQLQHQLQQQQIQQQLQQQQVQQQLQQQQLQQQMQQQQIQQQQQAQQQMQQQAQQQMQQQAQQQMQQQAQQQLQQQVQQQQAKQIYQQSLQTSQVYIPTQQQPTKNTVASSFTFSNQTCTEAVIANQAQSTPVSHSQTNQTSGNILGQAVPANQHGQYLTVNNNNSGGSNFPTALILPNGQIIPVVNQPSLLYSKSSPTNNSVLVTSSSNNSSLSTTVMSQATSLTATIPTNTASDATVNCEQMSSQNEQNDSLNSGLLTTVSMPETEQLEPSVSQASNITIDTSSAATSKEFSSALTTSVTCQTNTVEPAISTSNVTIPSESIVTTTSTIQNSTTTTSTGQSTLTTPIIITIPPQSNNLTPIFTSNITSDSSNKKPARKKTTQRAIKPKPVTSSSQSSQINQNIICTYPTIASISSSSYSLPTTSTIYSNSNHVMSISANTTDSKTQTDNQSINSGDESSIISTPTPSTDTITSISNAFQSTSSAQPTEPLTITTDILAKATESIFSNSLSDPSPPINNFYNADPSDFGIPGTNDNVNVEQNQQQNNQSDYINFEHSSLLINSKNIDQEINKNEDSLNIQNEQMNLTEVLKQVDALSEKAKSRKSKSGDISNEPSSKRTKKNQSERRGSSSSGNRSRTNSASKENSLQMHTMSMDSSGNIFLTATSNGSQSSHNVTVNSISDISTNSDQLAKTSSGTDSVLYNLTFSSVQTDNSTSGNQLLSQNSNNEELNIANSYQMINQSQPVNNRRHSHPVVEGMKSHNMHSVRRSSNTPNDTNISRASPVNAQAVQHQGNLTSPIRDIASQSSNMNNIISQALSMANVTTTNSSNCVNTTQQNQQQVGQNLQGGHANQQILHNSYCSQSATTNPIFTCMGTITYPGNNPNTNPIMSPGTLQSQGDRAFGHQNSAHQAETLQTESNPINVSKNINIDTSSSNSQSAVQHNENRALSNSSRHASGSSSSTTLRPSCTTMSENSNQGNARRGQQVTPETVASGHVSGVTLSHQSPGIEPQSPTVTGSMAVSNYSTEAILSDVSIMKESQYATNPKINRGKETAVTDNQKQNQLMTSPKSSGQNLASQQKTISTQGVSQANRPGISYSTERLLQSPTNNKRPCNTSNAIIGTTCVNSQAIPSSNSCSITATSSASHFLVNSIATTSARNVFSSTANTPTVGNQSQHSFPFYTNHSIVIQEQQNNPSHQPSPQQQARNMFHHFPSQNRVMDHSQQGINVQNTNRIRNNQIEVPPPPPPPPPPFSYTQPETSQQNNQHANNEVFGNIFNFPSARMGDDLLSPQGISQHKETTNTHSSQNQMNSFIQHPNFHGPPQPDQVQHNSNTNHSNSFVRPPFDSSFIGNQQQTFQPMNASNTFEQISAIQHTTRNTSSEETTRKSMNVVDKSKTVQQSKQKSKKAQNHKKNSKQFQEESEVNLSTSIFEPSRSVTPYFPIPNLSPPRNDAPTYIPNLFASPSRPGTNTALSAGGGKSSENNAPYNSLFAPRSHGGLSLNFQPGFGMKLHGNGSTSTQITSHSTSLTVTPHVPNFNLSNLFPDINPSGSDGINISPIKFHPGNPILPPPQPGMDPNPLQHHQTGTLYHNRPHPPVLHNAMSINSILGHNAHGFETRPQVSMGINSSMAPPFHGHGHNPSFSNVMPTLNFTMHEH